MAKKQKFPPLTPEEAEAKAQKIRSERSRAFGSKDQSRIPANPSEAAKAFNYSDTVNQRRNNNAARKMQPRRPVTPTPGLSNTSSSKPPLKFPDTPSAKADSPVPSKTARKQHPLALSGGRHPPDRKAPPKFSTPAPTKQDASPKPSEARTQTKGPASGTMSHTPDNATQQGPVASGGDRASTNVISGTEAVQRAASKAERKRLESELWSIGMGRSR